MKDAAKPRGWRERLLALIGYLSESRALRAGFTHHARLYEMIPCWYAPDPKSPDGALIEPKWRPLDLLEPVLRHVWAIAWECCHDVDEPPMWGIRIGRRIDRGLG